MEKIIDDIEIENKRWSRRYKIAIWSFFLATGEVFLLLLVALVSNDLDAYTAYITSISPIISTALMLQYGLAGAYMGLSTWKS